MWFYLLVGFCVVLFFRWLWFTSSLPTAGEDGLPPGPRGLPYLGFSLGDSPMKTLADLTGEFGDVISFQVLGETYVHLGSFDAVKEAYLKQGECFVGRPRKETLNKWLVDDQGILESEGQEWTEHRRFVLTALRDFQFGKLTLEDRVQEVAHYLTISVSKTSKKFFDPYEMILRSVVSVLSSLLFDKSFMDDDDEDFQALVKNLNCIMMRSRDEFPQLLSSLVPVQLSSGYADLQVLKTDFYQLARRIIDEHEQSFDSSRLRDYVDVYLDERRRATEEGSLDSSSFTIDRLKTVCLDLLLLGSETTVGLLYWALKLMAAYPEVQAKVQSEIDAVLPREKLPCVFDRQNLPYTEAVIMEIHRFVSIVVMAPYRSNTVETTLRGFRIPARSTIMANLYLMHRDPKYWNDPEVFDPQRFLDDDGKPVKKDAFAPFSLGKRICVGESLAKTEIFIFLTSLLQSFRFRLPEGVDTSDLTYPPQDTFVRVVRPYEVQAVPRLSTAL